MNGPTPLVPGAALLLTLLTTSAAAEPAQLDVTTVPAGLAVAVDGRRVIGAGGAVELSPGAHAVMVDDPCFFSPAVQIVVRAGERKELRLAGLAKLARLDVTAENQEGAPEAAGIEVDGVGRGRLPFTGSVPLCSSKLVLVTAAARVAQRPLRLSQGKVTRVRVVLPSIPPIPPRRSTDRANSDASKRTPTRAAQPSSSVDPFR